MRLQNANAFGARMRIVGEHDAERDGVARVGGISSDECAHTGDGLLLAAGGAVESLIVGQRNVAVGRLIAVKLAIDAQGIVIAALARELTCLPELFALLGRARHGLNASDVGIVGIDGAQTIEGLIGERVGSDELVIFGEARECVGVLRIGEKNLLPKLEGHVGSSAGLEREGFFSDAGASGLSGIGDGRVLSVG